MQSLDPNQSLYSPDAQRAVSMHLLYVPATRMVLTKHMRTYTQARLDKTRLACACMHKVLQNAPGAHASQAYEPGKLVLTTNSKPRRHVQFLNEDEPFSENELLKHCRHQDSSSAASVLLYLPAAHRMHADNPSWSVYVPGVHAVQLLTPANPLLHTQSSRLSLAACEVAFWKHCVQ